ncbi:MAG: hypothetical protein DRJ66_01610 [Thermoprotei archaeon]|nr:MAG: hypothetical protein DRJ66_01610 [Thermoprotei archaeon]
MNYVVEVYAGEHDRRLCPITLAIPHKKGVKCKGARIIDEEGREESPAQLEIAHEKVYVTFMLNELRRGEHKRFTIELLEETEDVPHFELIERDGILDIAYDGKIIASYNYSEEYSKPFIYPVIGPTGSCITENGPKDHVHHRSIWVAHGDVNGEDIWSEKEGSGRIVHNEFLKVVSGPIYSEIVVRNTWVSSNNEKILEEIRRMRFWKPTSVGWYLDHSVMLRAKFRDVLLGDTKEAGMIAIRVAKEITVERGGRIVNSYGGINETETWGKRAHWCDYYGMLNGEVVGIAIFDHIENPRHPTYWHVRNYGLMAANVFGLTYFHKDRKRRGDLKLAKGNIIEFTYRIFVHRGSTYEADVRGRYLDFVYPPQIKIEG